MSGNFVDRILHHVGTQPDATALQLPNAWTKTEVVESTRVSFGELGERIGAYQEGLRREGFAQGDRVVVLIPVSVDLYALVLALLASGIAAVLIDAQMGTANLVKALRDSGAKGIVSVDQLLRLRWFLPVLWGKKKYCREGGGLFMHSLEALQVTGFAPQSLACDATDHALITFTSGSTGQPKGADRTHGLLTAQHLALKEHFPETEDEVDMPCFPVVTLHNLCCGVATVLPPVDFAAVSSVAPLAVLQWAEQQGVTRMSGAPAYIHPIIAAIEGGAAPPGSLRTLGVGGARVSTDLCRRSLSAFPGVESKVLYGSTEAEPIASVHFEEVVEAAKQGLEGALVGIEAQAAEVALVALPEPPPPLDERGIEPFRSAAGELIVRGPHVNRGYLDNPEANAQNKLYPPDGTVWHRTGDVARRDDRGRLWLTGRVKDLVRIRGQTVHPFPLEEALDQLRGLRRSALVADSSGRAHLALEAEAGQDLGELEDTVREVLQGRDIASGDDGSPLPILWVQSMPVDRRHNSKIDRPGLRARLDGS